MCYNFLTVQSVISFSVNRVFYLFIPFYFYILLFYQFFNQCFTYYLFIISMHADVTEPLLIEVDQIYHLACPASPIFYKYNPVKVCIFYLLTIKLEEAFENNILTLKIFCFLSFYFSLLFSFPQNFQEQNKGLKELMYSCSY